MTIRMASPRRALAYLIFVGFAACGGKVVLVEEAQDGGGGSGTTSGTNSTGGTNTAGTGGFTCTDPTPENTQEIYDCIAPNGQGVCDPHDSFSVFQAMGEKVKAMVCGNGCCTDTNLVGVACGPDPTKVAECCYFAFVTVQQECTGGTGD